MKIKIMKLSILLVFSIIGCVKPEINIIDLSGKWSFAIDSSDIGINEKWFSNKLKESVILPGSMSSNDKGDEVGLETQWTGSIIDSSFYNASGYEKYRKPDNFKVPFWLQPLKYYVGAAWYQKEVNIPATWENQHISLFLERCHWESRLWIGNEEIGMRNSLGTPHIYNLTGKLSPGKHIITLRIDNSINEIDPGINSHSISDHTQTNWNGMVGALYIQARPALNIRSIQVYPDPGNKKIALGINILNTTENPAKVKLIINASGATKPETIENELVINAGESSLSLDYPMGDDFKTWGEFDPNLYNLKVILKDIVSGTADSFSTTFGMRIINVNDGRIEVNSRPVFLRGTLECAIFPKTGYPPTDTESWKRIFDICKSHGLNHMRFHSWCPPKAAFEAADQSGFYIQVEASSWANFSTTLGDGKPIDQYIYEETGLILEQYGNHPSFCMFAYGNEPGGSNHIEFLANYVNHWKSVDSRRIYVSAAGWPNIPENDFMNDPAPRIQAWGAGLNSIINREQPRSDYDWSEYISRFPQPVVSHEIGQWCVYPNFNEIPKYDGVLRARNFEIFRETLTENGMAQLADSFLLASGKLQVLCYKADIEAALRTKNFGGFQLLDLHDFPGQGTALVGILDAFWDEKGYISPEEFSRFCNSTVPLARLPKHIYVNNETFSTSVEVAHFGKTELRTCTPVWKITNKLGQIIHQGKLAQTDIPIGDVFKLGYISFPLNSIISPEQLTLELTVGEFSNSWDFWVYPSYNEEVSGSDQIRIVQKLDTSTLQYLENGGAVLLTLKKDNLKAEYGGNIPIGFSSIFWNTAWTHGQAPHTLGILCNPDHPALDEFPTEYHSNWQWWDAMSHSGAINLSSFPLEINPIVRVIDNWFTNRPLALIFEVKMGKGKLIVSGIDLQSDLANRPEARQLLFSLKKYMTGNKFKPTSEISAEKIIAILKQ